MPVYIKYCVDCKETYEIEKSYSDNTPFTCPKGHKRLVTKFKGKPPVIKYVGDGWTKKTEEEL